MNQDDFRELILAALIGSAAAQEPLNTWGVGNLIQRQKEITQKAWLISNENGNHPSLLLLVYASLLGSRGCDRSLSSEELEALWIQAKRLSAILISLKTEWQ